MDFLESVQPYLNYATEMRESDATMAYYSKYYAVQTGLKLCKEKPGAKANAAKQILMNEITDLESLKAQMGNQTKAEQQAHMESQIMRAFTLTDQDERECDAITEQTAVDFKQTGDFIAILQVFDGCYNEEWQLRKRYCEFKVETIRKALSQGIQPERGEKAFEAVVAMEEEKKEEVP